MITRVSLWVVIILQIQQHATCFCLINLHLQAPILAVPHFMSTQDPRWETEMQF